MAILTVGGWLAWGREGSPLLKGWFGGFGRGNRKSWEVDLSEKRLKKMSLTCQRRVYSSGNQERNIRLGKQLISTVGGPEAFDPPCTQHGRQGQGLCNKAA